MMDQAVATDLTVSVDRPKIRFHSLQTNLRAVALAGDVAIVFLALVFSGWLRFETLLARFGSGAFLIRWTDYVGYSAYGTLLFALLLPHPRLYDLSRILNLRQTLLLLVKTALRWLAVCAAFSGLFRQGLAVSRLYLVLACAVATAGLCLWRWLLCLATRHGSLTDRLCQRILFVGWSDHALALAQAIAGDGRGLYSVVGCMPSGRVGRFARSPVFIRKVDHPDGLPGVLAEHGVDTVILADINLPTEEAMGLAGLCEKEMIDFKVIPSGFQMLLSGLQLQTVSGLPVLGRSQSPLDTHYNSIAKRVVDLAGGLFGLMLSAPIIALFGLLVYRESPGPVIYRQRRTGRDGRPFWIFKIRSMGMDAEAGGKVGWTQKNDPRRLRVGAFMRRWNIDELPQFWNVIRGDMSLVGPRPERPELIRVFKEEIPHYNARHHIKPGITGWAQVNGFRGDTDLNERIRCDLYYIENWSALLDLQIMVLTFFRHKNAA